jgi:hypothetical protein
MIAAYREMMQFTVEEMNEAWPLFH